MRTTSPPRAATPWGSGSSSWKPTTAGAPSRGSKPSRRPPKRSRAVRDLRLIREHPDLVAGKLARRGGAELLGPLREREAARRRLLHEAEELKAERNRASEAIGQAKR